jgi:hypothetical protein
MQPPVIAKWQPPTRAAGGLTATLGGSFRIFAAMPAIVNRTAVPLTRQPAERAAGIAL